MRAGARDAHGGLGNAHDPRLDGGVAEQRGRQALVLRDHIAAVHGQQPVGKAGLRAVQSGFKQRQIDAIRLHDEGDLLAGNGVDIIEKRLQRVGMDAMRFDFFPLVRRGGAGRFPYRLAVDRHANDVGVSVPDGHLGGAGGGLEAGLNEYPAGYAL